MLRKSNSLAAAGLLGMMFLLTGGSSLHESATFDEVAHVGAGLSYWQRLDLRLNPEHPPLAKLIATLPLSIRGTHADYKGTAWNLAADFFPSIVTEWIFGDAVLGRWNPWQTTLLWARLPMILLTLWLGWMIFRYGTLLGGAAGGLLALGAYVATPSFLAFGPLVLTDLPVTLFTVLAVWQLGRIWAAPTARNALCFAMALAASLLSKFTGLLMVPVILILFLQTRVWPTAEQPVEAAARRQWRRERWACVIRGVVWSAAFVYAIYLVLSWNQPDDALNRVGSGSWAWLIRRPLMPFWLYCRGVLVMLLAASRPTYLFGHTYAHGIPYYFPVLFVLKSTLAFLGLLALAAVAAIIGRRRQLHVVPDPYRPHWRVLMVAFLVFLTVCLTARMNISIRHFMLPIVLLILILSPVPRLIALLPHPRVWQSAVVALSICSLITVCLSYPWYLPFANSLSMGRPAYQLFNGSNVSWNEFLPDLARFVREQHMTTIALDSSSFSDPAVVVPEAELWDCQVPTGRNAGQWVAVSAISILEVHNCGYLQQYPHRTIAGGSLFLFQMPVNLPQPGTPGGPPLPSARRLTWGLPFDFPAWMINEERHPEHLAEDLKALFQRLQQQLKS